MRSILINPEGELVCPACGSKTFSNRRTGRAKLGIGVAGVLTAGVVGVAAAAAAPKRMQCLGCREYLTGPPVPTPAPVVQQHTQQVDLHALRLTTGATRVVVTDSDHDGLGVVTMLKAAFPGLTVVEYAAMREPIRKGRLELASLSDDEAERLVVRLQEHGFRAHVERDDHPEALVHEPDSATPVLDQLERLAALLDRGVLSPEEFAAQKGRLLSG